MQSSEDKGENVGINQSGSKDWWPVVQKNREEDQKRVEKHGAIPRFPAPEKFEDTGNVKTTPAAEAYLAANGLKRDENGNFIPSTERGRRRRERLSKK